ncbi:MAG TPA: hypothetical protein VIL36_17310 [Acidimicrobiales bacterium]
MTDLDTSPGGVPDDELALPRFEERLLARLTAAHRAHNAANARNGHDALRTGTAADHADRRERPHRRQRRAGRRSLRAGVGAIAAAAAAVAVVAVVTGGADGDETVGSAGTDPTRIEDLTTRIISATQEAEATMVVHVTQDNTSFGDDDQWFDETTGDARLLQRFRDGRPSMDSAGGVDHSVVVDHCFAEYVEQPTGLPFGPGNATRWVQRALEDGRMVEDGTEVVDGRELIRLVERASSASIDDLIGPDGEVRQVEEDAERQAALEDAVRAAEDAATGDAEDAVRAAEDEAANSDEHAVRAAELAAARTAGDEDDIVGIALVDPETFRPVRYIGYPGSEVEYVQDYEYLPRTPENLANLEADVPADYTRVEDLRGDGERRDAGCV